MSRSLTAAMTAELGLTFTRPGWLVEIAFSSIVRLSSLGEVSWNGQVWSGGRTVAVEGLTWSLDATPRLIVGNADQMMGALVANQKVADRPVRIWTVYAGATASGDPLQGFDGVGDKATVGEKEVAITLARSGSRTLYSPRKRIGPETGFNVLMPAGTSITLGAATYVIERY